MSDDRPRTEAGRSLSDRLRNHGLDFDRSILAIETEAAGQRDERLREALEYVLDVWPAPSPTEFARLHRALTGCDSCDDERAALAATAGADE